MRRGNASPNPALQTEPQRPEVASEESYSHLGGATALAVVCLAVFCGDRLQAVDLTLRCNERSCHQGHQRRLLVAL